ncbi:hypothetical protein [Dactylosporangium sp. CA-233914]|uniref:hypothetical protein n=1 Tax=Dactylosporangium sp. CA-233914 TaxID=3239934 RepID=UPI003D8AA655
MAARQRILRWTARALVGAAAVGSALAFGTAAAAPPGTAPGSGPARAVSGVVVTGIASVTLLLLLAGAVLVATPHLLRLVRVVNARRSVR